MPGTAPRSAQDLRHTTRLPNGRNLYEIRFHGRGGQGTVLASILLAHAAFDEGRGVQAFPFFGVERRGAPVTAHARIGTGPVRLACAIQDPDAVVVMDPTLLQVVAPPFVAGKAHGLVIVGSSRPAAEIQRKYGFPSVATVDAISISRRHGLGSAANPIVNTALLGALVASTGIVDPDSLEHAIREHAPQRPDANAAAAREAAKGVDHA